MMRQLASTSDDMRGQGAGHVMTLARPMSFAFLAAMLDAHAGNTLRAPETLGLPRRTLNDKMRRYGLSSDVVSRPDPAS